jgi:hypothetical protein
VTCAATGLPPAGVSVKLCVVSVDGSIERSNVAFAVAENATPVAPGAGVRDVTDGGLPLRVVKLQVDWAARACPLQLLIPVDSVAV